MRKISMFLYNYIIIVSNPYKATQFYKVIKNILINLNKVMFVIEKLI